jgi:5-methylcytosine-specific restriction endonuclease McrA
MFGRVQSEETRKKKSLATKKRWENKEYRDKMTKRMIGKNNPMFGQTHSGEVRQLLSEIVNKRHEDNPLLREKTSKVFKEYYSHPENKKILSDSAKLRIGEKNPFFGKTHRPETKEKMAQAHYGKRRGERSSNWQGGKTHLNLAIRGLSEYLNWRENIFTRDRYTCQMCGQVGHNLQVDHIKAFAVLLKENNIQSVEDARRCEKLWDIENGRVLCYSCHKTTDTYCGRTSKRLK